MSDLKVNLTGSISASEIWRGPKGEPFTYEDFTEEQLASLKGEAGYTPVKAVDYYTEEEKQEIVSEVLTKVPAHTWNSLQDKPFGEKIVSATIELSEEQITQSSSFDPYMGDYSQRPFALEEGVNYKVNFNGTDYSCVGHITDDRVCIGNDSVFGIGKNTGEPFFIKDQDNWSEWIVFLESGDACTITVSYNTIKQLDPIYLPTTVPVILTACVGDTVKVKAVDENGIPTEWEAVEAKAAVISNAAGETPTAAEFNALLQALKDAGLMATE